MTDVLSYIKVVEGALVVKKSLLELDEARGKVRFSIKRISAD